MLHCLRKVTALVFSGSVTIAFALPGCTNRLGPVRATQNAGEAGRPNLPDIVIERAKDCVAEYGPQLEPTRHTFRSNIQVNEDGYKDQVTIADIPETAPDFGACMRNVLRDMPIAAQPFQEAVATLKYRREHASAEGSVVNLPGVTVVADVPIVEGELVLEVAAYTVVFAITVKVVDKKVKPIDLDKQTLARLGRLALDGLGYDEIIKRAEKLGWVKTVPIEQALSAAGKSFIGDGAAVAAQNRAAKLFTRYAVAAGITSQVDSPLPGLGDAVALGILVAGMLHAGSVMVDEIIAAEQVQAATATATPTASTTTTAPPIPIAVPRRYPGQTCDNNKLDELEGAKKKVCQGFPGKSCSPKSVSEKRLAEYPCSVIKARIPAVLACVAARQQIQDECFKNAPDSGHPEEIKQLTDGVGWCEALKVVNCAHGHPMAGL